MCIQRPQQSKYSASRSGRHFIPGTLEPGRVNICHFRLLIAMGITGKKNMQDALEEVLVRGLTRREACERHGVSQSHFSVKYRRLQMVNQTVVRMYPYIVSDIRMTE
ncbi:MULTISPECIES: PapB/FocB family fimbrial expression transcriptional regulator [Citrobacter]|nr:transcriptional regulator [Citrobacter freundii]MBC6506755.1 transcriptional regulator [Citrobacter freundii]MDG5475426.1 PapB/FocB family fimbrial expression transcriptional regulator [Citrobacter freundii]HCW0180999.1 transcriptional regulator [Citrobacter freundii]